MKSTSIESYVKFILLATTIITVSLFNSVIYPQTPWPMFRHDLQHTGRSPHRGSEQPDLKWSFLTGDRVFSSPAIDADGTIYVGSWDNNLYAINPDGQLKWSFAAVDLVQSSPAIGSDGTIYVGSEDNNLYAINPDGQLKWSFLTAGGTGGGVESSPVIGADGTIYVGSGQKLYAINPDGQLKWSFTTGNFVQSSPAIGSDGTIYASSNDFKLYAINPDGQLQWSFTTNGPIGSSPAIDLDGTIYVGSLDKNLYAINPDGQLKWSFAAGDWVLSSPAIGSDGTIYVGSNDNNLYAINSAGQLKWSFTTGHDVFSSPAIDLDGTIYVGSLDKNLYAINPDGQLKWSFFTGGGFSSPAIGSDGTIYVGSINKNLYAIGSQTITNNIIIFDPLSDNLSPVLIENGQITQNVDLLASADNTLIRKGAATDGVTKLVLRMDANPGDQIQLSILDDGQDNGFLTSLDRSQSGSTVTVTGTTTPSGGKAFAIYQAPNVFFNAPTTLFLRNITLNAVNLNTGSTTMKELRLIRPPVILVHGFWSEPGKWDLFKFFLNEPAIKFIVHTANYRPTHASSYVFNRNVLPKTIDQALSSFKKQTDLATVKVDVVAHSMGGVLSRWYLAGIGTRDYERSENYFSGDIRKLITVGTPHSGTQIANFLYPLRTILIPFGFFDFITVADLLRDLGFAIDDGAIFDLAVPRNQFSNNGTAILNSRGEKPTNNHAIFTDIELGIYPLFTSIPKIGTVLSVAELITDVSLAVIFEEQPNDVVVPTPSQRGGLGQMAQTYFPDVSHFKQKELENIASRVDELLELPPDDPKFEAHFNPVSLSVSPQLANFSEQTEGFLKKHQPATPSIFVQITSPSDGAVFSPGETITVTAQGSDGQLLSKVLLLTADTTIEDEAAPFEFQLTIPPERFGSYVIGALAKDPNGSISYDKVQISIVTSVALNSIKVDPPSVLLTTENESYPLSVVGFFADGIQRDITKSVTGTLYSTSNSNVATINGEGVLTAVDDGTCTVTVTSSDVSEDVEVTVNVLYPAIAVNLQPVATCKNVTLSLDAFGQATLIAAQVDGGSFDPDDDPITLSINKASFTCADIGENTATLTVDDGQTTDQCTATVTVVDDTPPSLTAISTPITRWPPNHKYQTITAAHCVVSVSDNCASLSASDVVITQVTSDEPDDVKGGGDGNTKNDIVIVSDCKSVQLRAERQGGGNGRVYTITLSVDDGSGNASTATCQVTAPKSQNGNPAVDDGPANTVTSNCSGSPKLAGANDNVVVEKTLPEGYELLQNHPNPFNPSTTITFAVPEASEVTLAIYNLRGQLVRTLHLGSIAAGYHSVVWDGTDNQGNAAPSGIYFYQLQAGDFTQVRKMSLLR